MPTTSSVWLTLFRAILKALLISETSDDIVEPIVIDLARTTRGRLILSEYLRQIDELVTDAITDLIEAEIIERHGNKFVTKLLPNTLSWKLDVLANEYQFELLADTPSIKAAKYEESLEDGGQDSYEWREWRRPVFVAETPEANELRSADANSADVLSYEAWKFREAVVSIPRNHDRGELERPIEERVWLASQRRRRSVCLDS